MIIPISVSGSTFTANARFPFGNGTAVQLDSRIPGNLPTPLLDWPTPPGPHVIYYLVNVTGQTFQVSATSGGSPITLTSTGNGQLSISEFPPYTWEQLVLLPIVRPSDIRSRWTSPEVFLNFTKDATLVDAAIAAKIPIALEWLYDELLNKVSNHVKMVGRSWWQWTIPSWEPDEIYFYHPIQKAQIVLDNLRNPEKLIPTIQEFVKWALVDDGMFRNQMRDASWFAIFGDPSSGNTLESISKKRAQQRLNTAAPLLLVSGNQGAHRIFDFDQVTDSISVSLI